MLVFRPLKIPSKLLVRILWQWWQKAKTFHDILIQNCMDVFIVIMFIFQMQCDLWWVHSISLRITPFACTNSISIKCYPHDCCIVNLWGWACEHETMSKMEYVKNIFCRIGQKNCWCDKIFCHVYTDGWTIYPFHCHLYLLIQSIPFHLHYLNFKYNCKSPLQNVIKNILQCTQT